LVFGNSTYQNAPLLPNGTSDAKAIASELEILGFDVSLSLDADLDAMRDSLEVFSARLRPGDVSLFYYAGHGLQVNGTNYLVPVDATLERPADLAFQGQSLDDVIEAITVEDNTAIVLLDACRNNPFAGKLLRAKKSRNLNVGSGLAPVQAGKGVYIGFATQPGNVALDGEQNHSPFATALLAHMATPGIDIEILMRRVRADVMEATDQQQVPWSNSSLVEPGFVFRPDGTGLEPTTQGSKPIVDPSAADLEFWRSVKDSTDLKMLRAYLTAFPKGTFTDIAKDKIAKLEKPTIKKKPQAAVKKSKPAAASSTTTSKPAETSRSAPDQGSTSGRCRDGDVAQCRKRCKQGVQQACSKLRIMGY
jgi:hypothetical protein